MPESNWTFVDDGLNGTQVHRGTVSGLGVSGGQNFEAFGFRSDLNVVGAVALFVNNVNFAPLKRNDGIATGGSIRAYMKKGAGVSTGCCPFVFCCLRGGGDTTNPSVNDVGYMLGLANEGPSSRYALRKAPLSGGIPTTGNLLASVGYTGLSQPIPSDQWIGLRLDVITTPHGDVRLKVYSSGLGSVPAWTVSAAIGSGEIIDDFIGAKSGSLPITGGFLGFGVWVNGDNKIAYFHRVEAYRQVAATT